MGALKVARLPIEPDVVLSDATTGQLLILGSVMPSNSFVAQPVHMWALSVVRVGGSSTPPGSTACDGRVIDLLRDVRSNDFVVTGHQLGRGRRRTSPIVRAWLHIRAPQHLD